MDREQAKKELYYSLQFDTLKPSLFIDKIYDDFEKQNSIIEIKINKLRVELSEAHNIKLAIIGNARKYKKERDIYYKNWIREIDNKKSKLKISLFLLGLGVGLVLGLGVY